MSKEATEALCRLLRIPDWAGEMNYEYMTGGALPDRLALARALVPEYAVVPREPTEEMLQDGLRAAQKARHNGISGQTVGAVVRASAFREAAAYRAMIAAGEATP